jgi:hypothetical protein
MTWNCHLWVYVWMIVCSICMFYQHNIWCGPASWSRTDRQYLPTRRSTPPKASKIKPRMRARVWLRCKRIFDTVPVLYNSLRSAVKKYDICNKVASNVFLLSRSKILWYGCDVLWLVESRLVMFVCYYSHVTTMSEPSLSVSWIARIVYIAFTLKYVSAIRLKQSQSSV